MYEQMEAMKFTPGHTFFYHLQTSQTNGTADTFTIKWQFGFQNTCQASMSSVVDEGEFPSSNIYNSFKFHTAWGAEVPGIEAAVDACGDLRQTSENGARITDVKTLQTRRDDLPCPVIEKSITSTTCGYRCKAKEVAADVEARMLSLMGCDEGTAWQTVEGRCSRNAGASLRGSAAHGIGLVAVSVLSLYCT